MMLIYKIFSLKLFPENCLHWIELEVLKNKSSPDHGFRTSWFYKDGSTPGVPGNVLVSFSKKVKSSIFLLFSHEMFFRSSKQRGI